MIYRQRSFLVGFRLCTQPCVWFCYHELRTNVFSNVYRYWLSRGRYPLVSSARVRHPLADKKLFCAAYPHESFHSNYKTTFIHIKVSIQSFHSAYPHKSFHSNYKTTFPLKLLNDCQTPIIHLTQKPYFLGISRYKFKLIFWLNLNLYREIWVCRFGGFRGCSVVSGYCLRTI